MAISPRRVYWDACTWIALIQEEKIRDDKGTLIEDRATMCKSVIGAAKAGSIEIVTSALSLVEVCKHPTVRNEKEDRLAEFFENDYILLANLDRYVGERARSLMLAGYSRLKPPDATHLATAAISNAEEMHTFDRRLLNLSGLVDKADGTKLKICKPDPGGDPMPLLEGLEDKVPDVDASEFGGTEEAETEEEVKDSEGAAEWTPDADSGSTSDAEANEEPKT